MALGLLLMACASGRVVADAQHASDVVELATERWAKPHSHGIAQVYERSSEPTVTVNGSKRGNPLLGLGVGEAEPGDHGASYSVFEGVRVWVNVERGYRRGSLADVRPGSRVSVWSKGDCLLKYPPHCIGAHRILVMEPAS